MRHLRALVTVLVGAGLLLAAPAVAHASTARADNGDHCDEYEDLADDLSELELSKTFDAEGYGRLADDFADAAKDAPASLAKSLKTSAKFYEKVSKSKTEKAAIALYLKGLKKYGADFDALTDYLADRCGVTTTTSP